MSIGGKGKNLGQHATAVSLGSRVATTTSRNGSKKPGLLPDWNSPDRLKALEILVDVGLSFLAAPTVAQPEGQTSPGE